MYDADRMEALIAEAAEGELGADEAQELEAIFGEAPDGRRTLEQMRVLVRAEKALSRDFPNGMHEFIMDGVDWNRRLDTMQRRTKLRALAAVAVACVVLVFAGATGLLGGNKKDDSAVESRVIAQYASEEAKEAEEPDVVADAEETTAEEPEAKIADASAAVPDAPALYESETPDEPIEERLALNTNCHTIVIADFAPPETTPVFTIDGYAAYELDQADFDAMSADGKLENVVMYTNHDGSGEKILLALRPQEHGE